MMIVYETKKTFWILRQFISKLWFFIVCLIIVFATPVYERSLFLTVMLIGISFGSFLNDLFQAYKCDIFSVIFDDEDELVKITTYKYGFNRMESSIPYNKLWYVKGRVSSYGFSGRYSSFGIHMRDNRSSPAQQKFFYVQTGFFGSFSEDEFYAILDKLTEIGQNYS